MALTFTTVSSNVVGAQRLNVINVTFDASYPTGGEVITPANMGMRARIDTVIGGASPYGAGAYVIQYDASGPYLKAISVADGAEAGDTTDLSAMTVNVIAIGE